ncbi:MULTISPECIES: PIN domain-containing protein [Saliphagus]|uniref:PIN domain-containing protein n=1 Tax=Saliphagus infecundisoli TaxID=1849069 RepID=A0ABD5QKU0_9EURY|nr:MULTISPECIES: PIN domain-containing protein [Saliphagus]
MDTSALMLPVEADVRVFEEVERLLDAVEPVVPRSVLAELEELSAGRGTEGRAASVGRTLAEERCRPVETDAEYADDALVELAREGDVEYVATADRALRDRVLDENVPVLALRGRNKLAITRP